MTSPTPSQQADEIFHPEHPVIIDVDDLTVGEQMEVEEMSGLPLGAMLEGPTASTKLLHALLFVFARRDHPTITPEVVEHAKAAGYGWRLDDNGKAGPTLPTEALGKRSLLSYALTTTTRHFAADDDETPDGELPPETDLPDELSPTD